VVNTKLRIKQLRVAVICNSSYTRTSTMRGLFCVADRLWSVRSVGYAAGLIRHVSRRPNTNRLNDVHYFIEHTGRCVTCFRSFVLRAEWWWSARMMVC